MAYKTDGSVHYSGIKSEGDVANFIKTNSVYGDGEVVKRGGTQYKQDVEVIINKIVSILISVKKKEKVSTGSFDYINTTKIDETLKKPFENLFYKVKKLRTKSETERKNVKDIIREEFNNISSDTLDELNGDVLIDFLTQHIIDKNLDMKMWIVDKENKKYLVYNFESSPLYVLLEKGYTPFLKETKKVSTSRTVLFEKDGETLDIGIRIRLVTNNGMGALLGLSKSNKSSSLTLKIQQDKVHNLIVDVKTRGELVEYKF